MASKGPPSAVAMSHAANDARVNLNWRALSLAMRRAAMLTSVPIPIAFGSSESSARSSAPEPVPRSPIRNGLVRDPRASIAASAASTIVSVSGLGTSVAALMRSGRLQNSLRRQCARQAHGPAAVAPMRRSLIPPWHRDCARQRRRGRHDRGPRAWPTRMRASTSGESNPQARNFADHIRLTSATVAGAVTAAAASVRRLVTGLPRPRAEPPDVR